MNFFFICLFSLCLFSCQPEPEPSPFNWISQEIEPLGTEFGEKTKDLNCKKKAGAGGKACWQRDECKKFCEDIFNKQEERQKCYAWPLNQALGFLNLYQALIDKERLFNTVQAETFKCFLHLTENNTLFFKHFSPAESKEFLLEISSDSSLAYQLSGTDKGNFNVLKTLFDKISSRAIRALKERLLDSRGNFLTEAHKNHNRVAQVWLDDYITYLCQKESRCSEPLESYCDILKELSVEELEDFFDDNRVFEKGYLRRVESQMSCKDTSNHQMRKCEYGNIEDFRTLCKNL